MLQFIEKIMTNFGCSPPHPDVLGFPVWYKYLPGATDPITGQCSVDLEFNVNAFLSLSSIGLAVIELLLRIAGLVAVAYIMYGGFQYMMSQGDPERARAGKDTVLNALIGLVIAIIATVIVTFIATRLTT